MDQAMQGGDQSSTPPVLPVKRKRGRPRKEQTPNRMEATPVTPGFQVVKQVKHNQPKRLVSINDVSDGIVGQAVNGVVEAAFEAGYLLTVRIGNSDANFRGVVFKPGHYLPVTAENDVAPHAQMIRRNEMHIHGNNRSRPNESPLANQLRGIAQRTTTKMTPKAKYSASTALSVPPVGARGTLVPVLLQPANMSNGLTLTHQVAPQGTSPELGDDEVHSVEPLAMLPPDVLPPNRQVPVSQTQSFPSQPRGGQQVVAQNGNGLSNTATMTRQEVEHKPVKSAKIHTPVELSKRPEGSSSLSEMQNKNKREVGNSSEEPKVFNEQPFQAVNSDLQQSVSVSQPLKSYPTGRMTELLLALQENIPDNQVPQAENLSSSSETDSDEDSRD